MIASLFALNQIVTNLMVAVSPTLERQDPLALGPAVHMDQLLQMLDDLSASMDNNGQQAPEDLWSIGP